MPRPPRTTLEQRQRDMRDHHKSERYRLRVFKRKLAHFTSTLSPWERRQFIKLVGGGGRDTSPDTPTPQPHHTRPTTVLEPWEDYR